MKHDKIHEVTEGQTSEDEHYHKQQSRSNKKTETQNRKI